jgi:hypothetical protein
LSSTKLFQNLTPGFIKICGGFFKGNRLGSPFGIKKHGFNTNDNEAEIVQINTKVGLRRRSEVGATRNSVEARLAPNPLSYFSLNTQDQIPK